MLLLALAFCGAPALLCQDAAAPAQRPAFEVVSIKLNRSGNLNGGMGPRGSRLVATNVTLNTLLLYAYSRSEAPLLDSQIMGLPNWAAVDHYDIEAKAEGGALIKPGEQTRAMVATLLADSFGLKMHMETRELPVYNLVLTKNGPKLSADQTPLEQREMILSFVTAGEPAGPLPRGMLRMIAGPNVTMLQGQAIAIPRIVQILQSKAEHKIIDTTGFTGLIDLQLTFGPELIADAGVPGAATSADAPPPLRSAIQELGLKLEPGKAPVQVLVVDRVQHPREN